MATHGSSAGCPKSSSQRPLGYMRARRWYSVLFPLATLLRSSLSGPSLGSETSCRGGCLHTAPTASQRLVCRSRIGLGMQLHMRQQVADNRCSEACNERRRSNAKRRSVRVTCNTQRTRMSDGDNSLTGTLLQCRAYCNKESIVQCTLVPYIQVDDLGTVTI